MFRDPRRPRPDYLVELELVDGAIVRIRDFRYVPYIADDAAIEV